MALQQAPWRHRAVRMAKELIYGRRGEPYRIGGHTLRFKPGTRPVRLRYATAAEDWVSRYDALQFLYLVEHIRPGMTCLDVGGFYGQDALVMAVVSGPSGRVTTFEPDPHARQVLKENLALNPTIRPPVVEALAIADRIGEAVLYSRGGDSNSSLAPDALGRAKDLEGIIVPVTTLDAWIAKSGAAPDLVKIDIEGAEIQALSGARALLQGPATVLCELHPYAWEGFGSSFAELDILLQECGRAARYLDGKPFSREQTQGRKGYGIVVLEHQYS